MEFEQLSLFSADNTSTVIEVEEYLKNVNPRVSLVFTRNRVSMISFVTTAGGDVNIRMHEGFLDAPWRIIESLGRYLGERQREDWDIVSRYARQIPTVESNRKSKIDLRSKGNVYDLNAISKSVNREFFSGRIQCRIGWSRGRRASKKQRVRGRYIRFGSWTSRDRLIKVHPVLDDVRVPIAFVRYIIFHEMLHAVVPQVIRNGRSYDHTPQFKKIERSFPDYIEMKHISRKILNELV